MKKYILVILIFLTLSFSLYAEDIVSDSLLSLVKEKGRQESWLKNSEKIRENLSKLKETDAKVQKWLPAIKRRCATLNRLYNIGSHEKWIFCDVFEAMLEDIVNDKKVLARYAGKTMNYGYWSDLTQRLTGTKIQVPPDYDSNNEHQMVMYYKLGGGLYWRTDTKKYAGAHDKGAFVAEPYRPSAEMCKNSPETFHVWSALYFGVKGRMGAVEELKEISLAMSQDFSISPDRVFLSGFSDGGFTSMWLASKYPHLVAGIMPEVANWQYNNTECYNFFNFPTLVVDGWLDGGFIQENLARYAMLRNMGYDISCMVSDHGHQTKSYEEVETFKKMMEWAKSKRRDLNRKHIKYTTWNLAWNRAFWFTIERMENPSFVALVDAKIEGNTIHVKAKNISAYKIDLNEKLVDKNKEVKIITNGKETYSGPYKDVIVIDFENLPAGTIVKSHETFGGMTAHANIGFYNNEKDNLKSLQLPSESWIWVTFSGGEDLAVAKSKIGGPSWSKVDTLVSEEDIKNKNLIIYGGPLRNKFLEKIAKDLPVQFEKGKFMIGSKVYDEPQQWVKFICANPLNHDKTLLIYAFNDPAEAYGFKSGKQELSPWGFRDGDCIVNGVRRDPVTKFGIGALKEFDRDYYIFDSKWQAPDQTVIGTAEKSFDWNAILQLKASAIKEAAEVDVGLYGAQPGFNMWEKTIEKGPLIINDIVVVHQLPEFIVTCDIKGGELLKLVGGEEGSSKLSGINTLYSTKDEPGYDPATCLLVSDIKKDKIYKAAVGYSLLDGGTIRLSGSPEKMPKPHFYWESIEDFNKQEGTSMNFSNLTLTEIEVAEAVVSYIKKRGKVSPRPQFRDLKYYAANPEINLFGEFDWLHISLPYTVQNTINEKVVSRSPTYGLGLKAEDSTESFQNYQKFIEMDILKNQAEYKFDMSNLNKKLPVTIDSKVIKWGIVGDSMDKASIKLTDKEGEIGTLSLLKITIKNNSNKRLLGMQLIADSAIGKIDGSTWPGLSKKKNSKDGETNSDPYYYGLKDNMSERKKTYNIDGFFFVSETEYPNANKLIIPSGYNVGFIGLSRDFEVEANATIHLALISVQVGAKEIEKPKLNLTAVMDVAKPAVMEELKK